MTTLAGLPIDIRERDLRVICEKYGVRELLVFGSALRDDFGPESDIDLLVEFAPGTATGFFKMFDLRDELTALFGRRVDLVSRRGLNPFIEKDVVASARPIYAAA